MRREDAAAVHALASRAFGDLTFRMNRAPYPAPTTAAAVRRFEHLQATDPAGAWVADGAPDGGLSGAAVSLVRGGLWGLSLLVVDPRVQSAGLGTELLARALEHGRDARGGVILASEDERALRAYARAGFGLEAALEASGVPRPIEAPAHVRPGGPEDTELMAAVDRAVRGVEHGADLEVLLAAEGRALVIPGRGYAVCRGGDVRVLAAFDEPAAQDLLRAAIAGTPAGERASLNWITAKQQGWALPPVLEAGLDLQMGGAVCVRGEVGPFRPYIPSGAYL